MELILTLIMTFCINFEGDIFHSNTENDINQYLLNNEYKVASYQAVIKDEITWMLSIPLDSGVIPLYKKNSGDVDVNPYFSNIVAEALIESKSDGTQRIVLNYINWYLDHINSSEEDPYNIEGTIFDYNVTVDKNKQLSIISKNKYDSIDSYAATFIILLNKYVEITEDDTIIKNRWDDILKVHQALLSTYYKGLMVNDFKDYNRYLMDNSEVYKAVNSSLLFFKEYKGTKFYDKNRVMIYMYYILRESIEYEIENNMWTNNGYYHIVIFKNNTVPKIFDWNVFYPDATAQIFPIIYSLIEPESERAKAIYNTFNENYNWEKLDHLKDDIDGFYWGILSYLAVIMNDENRFEEYIKHYKIETLKSRVYPLFAYESAWIVKALNYRIGILERRSHFFKMILLILED